MTRDEARAKYEALRRAVLDAENRHSTYDAARIDSSLRVARSYSRILAWIDAAPEKRHEMEETDCLMKRAITYPEIDE